MSEDEASYQDSSSESDDEADEGNEGDSPEARAKAMAEARLMLKDQRSKKRRRDYLEDEVQHLLPLPPPPLLLSLHTQSSLCLPVAVPLCSTCMFANHELCYVKIPNCPYSTCVYVQLP